MLKKACADSPVLSSAFAVCREVMVRLDGKKSHLRKELLQRACTDTGTAYKKPVHPAATRFGSQEKTAQRCIDLKRPIDQIQPEDFAHMAAEWNEEEGRSLRNTSWVDLKHQLSLAYAIFDHILPVFVEIEQWTQILSSKFKPTISKIRLACRRVSQHLGDLRIMVETMERKEPLKRSSSRLSTLWTWLVVYTLGTITTTFRYLK